MDSNGSDNQANFCDMEKTSFDSNNEIDESESLNMSDLILLPNKTMEGTMDQTKIESTSKVSNIDEHEITINMDTSKTSTFHEETLMNNETAYTGYDCETPLQQNANSEESMDKNENNSEETCTNDNILGVSTDIVESKKDDISETFNSIEIEIARIVGEDMYRDENQENSREKENIERIDENKSVPPLEGSSLDMLTDLLKDDEVSIIRMDKHNVGDENSMEEQHENSKKEEHENSIEVHENSIEEEYENSIDEEHENSIEEEHENSIEEEHENSIDEEEIEDYDLFLKNSVIENDGLEEEEQNEDRQSIIYYIDCEELSENQNDKDCWQRNSNQTNEIQYDLMQLADVKVVERVHRCPICPYSSGHVSALRRHISISHYKIPWTCKYCRKKFTSRFFGEKHIQAEHSRKKRKCPHCQFQAFCSGAVLQKHITLQHGYTPSSENEMIYTRRNTFRETFRCHRCAYTCRKQDLMRIHLEMHGLEYVLRCLHCYYMINSKKLYEDHVANAHKSARKIFICTKCFFQTESWDDYYSHVNSSHNSHDCTECDFTTPYIELFYSHINSHGDVRSESFVCNTCGYIACSDDDLSCHVRAQHSEKKDVDARISEGGNCIEDSTNEENVIEFEEIEEIEDDGNDNGYKEKTFYPIQQELETDLNTPNTTQQTEEEHDANIEKHHENSSTPLNCPLCESEYLDPKELSEHILTKHSDSSQNSSEISQSSLEKECNMIILKCPRCPENELNLDEFCNHSNKHCPHCDFQSQDSEVLKEHMIIHENQNKENENSSTMNSILEENQRPSNVSNEVNNVVEEIKSSSNETLTKENVEYKGIRSVRNEDENQLMNEFESEISIDNFIPNEKPLRIIKVLKHQCFDCLMIYKSRFTLLDHRRKKHGLRKPHSCTYCLENFETYNDLKSHYYRVHKVSYHNNGPFYKCPLCEITSKNENQLKRHVFRKHQRKPMRTVTHAYYTDVAS